MQRIRAFNQHTDVMERVSGGTTEPDLAFRITFKWSACTVSGGQYNYTPNADKTAAKHGAYHAAAQAEEARLGGDFSRDEDFERFVALDREETRRFVDTWGRKFTDADKRVFSGARVIDQSDVAIHDYLGTVSWEGDAALIGVFYGRLAGGRTAWQHVVGYSSRGGPDDAACFFDADSGLYAFDPGEDVTAAVARHIEAYARDGRSIESFNTLRLSPGVRA